MLYPLLLNRRNYTSGRISRQGSGFHAGVCDLGAGRGRFAKRCWPVLYWTRGLKVKRRRDEADMNAVIADLLTLSRVVAAGALLWLGLTSGASALPAAALVVVLGWTTDQLDGWFARRSPTPTRLKDSDFCVDLIFYAGHPGLSGFGSLLPGLAGCRIRHPGWRCLAADPQEGGGCPVSADHRRGLRRHHLQEHACHRFHVGGMVGRAGCGLSAPTGGSGAALVGRSPGCMAWEGEMMSGMIWSGALWR